jgi:hypothetical protein
MLFSMLDNICPSRTQDCADYDDHGNNADTDDDCDDDDADDR